MYKQVSLFAAVVVMLVLSSTSTSAHFLWLDSESSGETRVGLLFFGESLRDRNYHLPAAIADAKIYARTGEGKREMVTTTPRETEDYVGLEMPLSEGELVALETACEYGIYAGSKLCYYAQHLLPSADGNIAVVTASELKLNIVIRSKAGGLAATVLWEGKPLEGAVVTLIDPDGETLEETSDALGEVFFVLSKAGQIGLMTNHSEKEKSGEFNGQKYKGQANYSTLTLNFTPQRETSLPAKKVSTIKKLKQTKHSFGPPLPEAISSFGAAVNNDWLYIYSGHTGKAHQHSCENLSNTFARLKLSDPTDWELLEMQSPLQGMALVSCGENLYRVGGLQPQNTPREEEDLRSVDEFSRFNTATGRWTALQSLPAGRSSHDAAVLDGKIYVVGGWTLTGDRSGDWQTLALVYDTSAGDGGEWKELSLPPFQRRALALATWNERIWVLGGMDENADIQRTVYSFDPSTNTWEQGPLMPGDDMQGFGISAWGLDSGLYVSGTDGKLYRLADPAGQWEAVAELETPRFFHRIVPDGRGGLLAIGGASLMDGHLREVESIKVH